jgi:hypothetical protein
MLVEFVAPRLGFGLICGAPILHLRSNLGQASQIDDDVADWL